MLFRSIRYVTNGSYLAQLKEYENFEYSADCAKMVEIVKSLTDDYAQAVEMVTSTKNQDFLDLMARRLVELAGNLVMAHLMLRDATKNPDMFLASAKHYVRMIQAESAKNCSYIKNMHSEL